MKLYYSTVSPLLLEILKALMARKEFSVFRLVGGTALSLMRGHRISVDVDLFTDEEYGSVDFVAIDRYLRSAFPYVDTMEYEHVGMGKSYYVGETSSACIKLDLYYTDKFIRKSVLVDEIRLANEEDIIAMKMDVIMRTGRKKDFWDIDELKDSYTIEQMAMLHEERYPFAFNKKILKEKLVDFSLADDDFEPICLKGKYWELIKLDIVDCSEELKV